MTLVSEVQFFCFCTVTVFSRTDFVFDIVSVPFPWRASGEGMY